MTARPTLVALRPLGLGDFLTGVPAYRGLARAFPAHRRLLAAPEAFAPLVRLVPGAFDALVPTQPLEPLSRDLREADIAVDLHGRGPASQRILLAAMPRRLIAFANDEVPETAGSPLWRANEHEVVRWCRMLEESGILADPGELDLAWPENEPPPFARGATIVHVGAASAARRWPIERFAEVARSERRAGRTVIVTGGSEDGERAAELTRTAGLAPGANLAGTTSLCDLAAIVSVAGRVVSGDTGIAHLAVAYRTPTVTLFGPTSPQTWGPPSGRDAHRAIWHGRTGDPHGERLDRGLSLIDARHVIDELALLPQR